MIRAENVAMNDNLTLQKPLRDLNAVAPKRLAFVDLDDTLLGPDKTISRENLAALEALRAAETEIVVASGRHHHNVQLFREIGNLRWIVSSQGGMVGHVQSGKSLREVTLAPELATEICEQGRRLGVSLLAYDREGARAEIPTKWTEFYAAKAGWQPRLGDFRNLPPGGFVKVLWSDEPKRIAQLAEELAPTVQGRFQMLITEPELLEFAAREATKAEGAAALTRHLGLRVEDTIAFGDGNNDVEILQWAGMSVAMAHGRPSARRAARFISPPGPPETAFARAVELVLQDL
jgi:Cof subfamily protein (haloacid dehalogenase superfamily)